MMRQFGVLLHLFVCVNAHLNNIFCQINTNNSILHTGLHNVNCVRTITLTHFREGVGESNYLPILTLHSLRELCVDQWCAVAHSSAIVG